MQILEHIELRKKTTLRLGGIAPFFYDIRKEVELLELQDFSEKIGMEIKLLGGGSNLLIADESLGHTKDILPFSVAQIQISYEDEEKFHDVYPWQDDDLTPPLAKNALKDKITEKTLRAEVGAGMALQKFIKICADKGCSGLEGLIGVPGKIGGAIAMNAGAYNSEIDQVLESVRIYHKDFGLLTLSRHEFKNSYRKFTAYYKDKEIQDYIICGASFVFPVIKRTLVKAKMQENLQSKKATQPIKAFTAGCVFKNPLSADSSETLSAGKLLDEAGFKGKEKNGMRFSPIHANFLENTGNGDSYSAIELIKEAEERIFSLFNIKLEKEVKLWL